MIDWNSKTTLAWTRALSALLVLGLGIRLAIFFVQNKPEAKTQEPTELELSVRLSPAKPSRQTVMLTAHGISEPNRTVNLTSEVSGKIVSMPRNLKAGHLVKQDELLLQIDDRDYQAALVDAEATVIRLEANLEQLDTTEQSDKAQLKLAKRSFELAQQEFERIQGLYKNNESVSLTAVETAERTANQASSQVIALEQSLSLTPSRRKETESQLNAAKARVAVAKHNLERTRIKAPFPARILESSVEIGSNVQPGMSLFRLSDDRVIEIPITVTAQDLVQWMSFDSAESDRGWFAPLRKEPVDISWSSGTGLHHWQGVLDRIVDFDSTTRTATLAVRVEGPALRSEPSGLPLTSGMFCTVSIPGREVEHVFMLPRGAVTFDEKVYISDQGRLRTVDVNVLRSSGDQVMVQGGIQEGDLVVLTRLVAPLEGTLLKPVED
jgi:RND family efflux transporter MFP subunit